MRVRSLVHLSNGALLSALDRAEARDRSGIVELLGYLAEVDRRRLYVPAGYPSMFEWCVETRHYSEAMASRRIATARAARRFPVILDMIADGRLHLTAVALLSRKLDERNADELLAAAVRRSRRQIQHMLAERFPQPDVPTQVQSVPPGSSLPSPVTVNSCSDPGVVASDAVLSKSDARPMVGPDAATVPGGAPGSSDAPATSVTPTSVRHPAPAAMQEHSRVAPLAPQRCCVQFTMDEAMHADLERAQALLRPGPGEDRVKAVFRRALRELVTKLEKQKFAATNRPRTAKPAAAAPSPGPRGRETAASRRIPAAIRREVWARDQGQCTFVGTTGHRCKSHDALEFDHIVPLAKGGVCTAANLRLLCRAHNQHEAEQAFGEGYMHEIRERARRTASP